MNKIKIACFLTLALLVAGFAPAKAAKNQVDLLKSAAEPVIIKAIEHSESGGSTELVIRANIPFEYTSYDPDPGTLVVEIPEGNIESLPPELNLDTSLVKNVKVKKIAGKGGDFFIGRVEVTYSADSRHTISMEGSDLHIRMEKKKIAAEAAGVGNETAQVNDKQGSLQTEPTQMTGKKESAWSEESGMAAASRVSKINIYDQNDSYTEVVIEADGKLAYKSLKLDDPERMVIDIQNVSMLLPGTHYSVKGPFVDKVRTSQYKTSPERIARIVFDLKKDVPFDISQSDNLLKVRFSEIPESASSLTAPGTIEAVQEKQEEKASEKALSVNALETAQRAEIQGSETAENPPVSIPEANKEIETLAPQYSKQELEKIINEKAKEDYVIFKEEPEKLAAESEKEKKQPVGFQTVVVTPEKVKFTGKKISLNLVDADIKQVFRLFHEISGLNFVLDPGVGGKVTIVLDNLPWDQALDIILKNNGLDKVFEDNVIRIAATQKLAQEAASRKQLKDAKELESDPVTITRTLSYAKATEVEKIIRQSGMISQRGRVIMDERTNSLIVTDVPTRISPIDNLISSIDSETPQVMIEARIVETSRQFAQDFGIKWGFTGVADTEHGTQTNMQFPHNAKVNYRLNLPFTPVNATSPNLFGVSFGNVLNSFNLDLAIEALEVDGKARVLSAPKIATQNNEKAEIERGVRIPVVNTTATEINVEFVSASLRLMVTPQITAEGTIVLDITVENNTPDFVNRVGDVPPINTQRAQTVVLINDGGTTVIGGIFSQSEGLSEIGVPWFRKIPLFGWLFKRRNVSNEDRELLIFLTARIMRSSS